MNRQTGHAPLVWFTSLAIGGAGMICAAALRMKIDSAFPALALAAGSAALGAGLVISMLHLGRKSRALLAANGVGRSPLSHEIVLAGATLAAGLALLPMYWGSSPQPWIRLAAAATAALFLLSIGLVYRLGGQRSWSGVTVLAPLVTGLVCGETCLQVIGTSSTREITMAFWPMLIPVDAIIFLWRWWRLPRTDRSDSMRRIGVGRFRTLSAARLCLFDIGPLMLLTTDAAWLAGVAVAAGLALDRWLFYALADQHTTEVEVGRVEAFIGSRSRIG